MVDRIKAALDGRNSDDFTIMARTDALANEGLDAALDRVRAYVAAGAEMIFPEAVGDLATYQRFREAAGVPILANITEFGKTPLFSTNELLSVGVDIALYPLSAFRAMNKAAELVYKTIREDGTQKDLISHMQTREELYEAIDYYKYEETLDKFQSNQPKN
jgi:methylisocitrate lyase